MALGKCIYIFPELGKQKYVHVCRYFLKTNTEKQQLNLENKLFMSDHIYRLALPLPEFNLFVFIDFFFFSQFYFH